MKKLYVFVVTLLVCVAVGAVTHPFAGLGIVDYKITSVWPDSFREVSGSVDVTISNDGTERTVKGIYANVFRNGAAFASGTCSDVNFVKGTKVYALDGTVKLADGVSVWTAIGAALSFTPSEYVVEVTMTMIHESGEVETVVRKVPATRFLSR